MYPNRRREKKLTKQGFVVAGVDEAGRGAWAGPLVAAAVILDPAIKIKGIKDSKKLRARERNLLYEKIVASAYAWSTVIIDAATIDVLGLTAANVQALAQALTSLSPPPTYALVDGPMGISRPFATESITDGDHKVTSIAAASIIAKVTRDRIMDELDELYPAYGFKQHKGYGTPHHFHMLTSHGVCEIHRKSFRPIKDLL